MWGLKPTQSRGSLVAGVFHWRCKHCAGQEKGSPVVSCSSSPHRPLKADCGRAVLSGLLVGTLQNLFSVSDVANFRVFEICRILVCNWHKPHFLSSLNGFSYFLLLLPTEACYVPSVNASGKWRNKLGQKLHILVIYMFLTQDALLKRLLIGVFHWDWQVFIAGYLFIL